MSSSPQSIFHPEVMCSSLNFTPYSHKVVANLAAPWVLAVFLLLMAPSISPRWGGSELDSPALQICGTKRPEGVKPSSPASFLPQDSPMCILLRLRNTKWQQKNEILLIAYVQNTGSFLNMLWLQPLAEKPDC